MSIRLSGMLPRRISSVCSLFLRHGGVIDCVVAGVKQYSTARGLGPVHFEVRGSNDK